MFDTKLLTVLTRILSEDFESDSFNGISDEEWVKLFEFARHQGVKILLYDLLQKNKIEIPRNLTAKMKQICYSACAEDEKRKKQLKGIIRLFNDNEIAHILLKGSALISTVYEDSICRSMCDIDILVNDADAHKAYGMLIQDGYESYAGSAEEAEKFKAGFNQHYPQLKKAGFLPFELHTRISNASNVNLEGIWRRSRILNMGNLETRVMCSEDLIMHIAFHNFLQHGAMGAGLIGLYDICLIIRSTKIDWSVLKRLTRKGEYDNSKCLYLALYLVKKLLKENVNEEFLTSIRPEAFPEGLIETVMGFLFSGSSHMDNNSFRLGLKMYDVRNNSSTALRNLFFSPQRMALYGRRVYGRGDMTFRNLSILYTRRTLTLVNRYGSAFFKQLFMRNRKKQKSAGFGRDSAAFKSWMLQ